MVQNPTDATYPYDQSSGGGSAPTVTAILYTNAKGGAMLSENGQYRWLQPSEVAAAENYVKTVGGSVTPVDDAAWAGLVKLQQGAGSSGMSTSSVPTGQYASRLSGFDVGKLSDLGHNSPKYVYARIASNFNTTDPEQRRLMLEMLRSDPSGYFRNATIVGDKLNIGGTLDPAFGGINQFDIFGGSSRGEWTPTWQPTAGPGYVAETPAASALSTLPNVNVAPVAGPPSNYGASPTFAQVNPYAGMSPEAYRMLAPAPTTLNTLALPAAKR